MAFHPRYATNTQVFLSFTETGPSPAVPLISRLARFTTADNGATFALATRQNILSLNQPYTNHKGGNVAFGPDGFLYIGFGDGGSGGDPQGHAQNTRDLLGDMLRLDVDHGTPYAIPSGATGNPFAANPICPGDNSSTHDCPEIYATRSAQPVALELRRRTGDLWVGDVGQDPHEEVDRIERGGNYGWNCREGPPVPESPPRGDCSTAPLASRSSLRQRQGNSITGGFVYRGTALPALPAGMSSATMGSGASGRSRDGQRRLHAVTNSSIRAYNISAFGLGDDGELYFASTSPTARIGSLVDGGGQRRASDPVPSSLADTGCVDARTRPQAGGRPDSRTTSNGAVLVGRRRRRNGISRCRTARASRGLRPATSTSRRDRCCSSHFRVGGQLIETRLLMRHPDGVWAGYTYEWNNAQTAATRVVGGKTRQVGGQTWIYPSEGECLQCHTSAAGFSLGLEIAQLNGAFTYPSSSRVGKSAGDPGTHQPVHHATAGITGHSRSPGRPHGQRQTAG